MNLKEIQQIAIAAAYHAGKILYSHYGHLKNIQKKGVIDLVTEADVASEKMIKKIIQNRFPDHGFIAEESGRSNSESSHKWIIDPLDGTTNYAHQIPIFAVSIAFAEADQPLVGVVFNPISQELFTAVKGQGAMCNGRLIEVSKTNQFSDSILVTGFPYNLHDIIDPLIKRFARCLESAQAVRRLGAASIDLCYIASGKFDGFWEQNLKPWDTAAGMLIAQEAGAQITNFSNNPYHYEMPEIVASNGFIHNDLINRLTI
ncbi:inositol-phosphate phosphatase [Candidatus Magnetomorum sp. HK-1]|nr:inositol-phosphate phosphatase [Candidatus Magnetomorum sp. HK-1]